MDADIQNDPMDIPHLIEMILKGSDCVVGWRHKRKYPFVKRYMSIFARHLRKMFLGMDLHDYGCSLKPYTKKCERRHTTKALPPGHTQ